MNVCVIGTGYVGLIATAVFADWGNNVVGVDIDKEKIDMIKQGKMPIYEPGLAEVVEKNVKEGRLTFTTNIGDGIRDAEIVFICVGTPQDDTGAADLSYVWGAAEEIGKNLNGYKIIVTKSTVPVGTNEKVAMIVKDNLKKDIPFDVASNPEFLKEGSSVEDMRHPDRTILGSNSQKAIDTLKQLYAHLNTPVVECNLRTAEMIKYASNAFLATKISFINEIAQICERAGADVSVVADGMGLDKRIGRAFLYPSIGYGGSCFPKDVAALYRTSTDQAYDFKLLRGVMEVNERQKEYYLDNIVGELGKNLDGKVIACLGLSFKANTDDVRKSVALTVIQRLRGLGAALRVYDPKGTDNSKDHLGDANIYYASDSYDAVEGADALCILTEWKEFQELDFGKVKELMKGNYVFDGRNLLDINTIQDLGFTYFAIGRPTNGTKKISSKFTRSVLLS